MTLSNTRGIPSISAEIVKDPNKLRMYLAQLEGQITKIVQDAIAGKEPTNSNVFIDLRAIRDALSRSGEYPLNVEGLPGVLAESQIAGILIASSTPPVTQYPIGTLMVHTGSPDTFKYLKAGNPPTWQAISTAPTNMMTTDTNQLIAAGVVKTWTAQQVFTGGLSAGAQVKVTAGGIDVDAGGVNIDAGQFTSASQFGARAYQSVAQPIANVTLVGITFTNEVFDRGACHDNGVNPTRMTVPAGGDGLWMYVGQIGFTAAAGGVRMALLYKNGLTPMARFLIPSAGVGDHTIVQVAAVDSMVAGDYVELVGYQSSGGAINTQVGDAAVTWFASYRYC